MILKQLPTENEQCLWHPYGWDQLVVDLHEKLLATDPDYTIYDTKEKMGWLRVMTSPLSEQGRKTVQDAEAYSIHMCQECGQLGSRKHFDGWSATLCDLHRDNGIRGYGKEPTPSTWEVVKSSERGGTR